jgi:hypothetical protein
MNKFGTCDQWRSELFESARAIFHLSSGKAVMSFLHFWKWREKCLHGEQPVRFHHIFLVPVAL